MIGNLLTLQATNGWIYGTDILNKSYTNDVIYNCQCVLLTFFCDSLFKKPEKLTNVWDGVGNGTSFSKIYMKMTKVENRLDLCHGT